jgi:hypothetical protein
VDATFQILKASLCATLILAYSQSGERFIVDTDAHDVRIGGVLSQVQEGQEQVIAYYKDAKHGGEELLCHLMRITCHCENTGTFP